MAPQVNLEKFVQEGGDYSEAVRDFVVVKTRIFGGYFQRDGLRLQAGLKAGEELFLEADTGNIKDCFAVAVYRKETNRSGEEVKLKLGYLKRELASAISTLSDFRCRVEEPIDIEDLEASTKAFGASILLVNVKKLANLI